MSRVPHALQPLYLQLRPVDPQVHQVLAGGHLVGSLKQIGARWRFKAIGQDSDGSLVPGGGPLSHCHNTEFAAADEAAVNNRLGPALANALRGLP